MTGESEGVCSCDHPHSDHLPSDEGCWKCDCQRYDGPPINWGQVAEPDDEGPVGVTGKPATPSSPGRFWIWRCADCAWVGDDHGIPVGCPNQLCDGQPERIEVVKAGRGSRMAQHTEGRDAAGRGKPATTSEPHVSPERIVVEFTRDEAEQLLGKLNKRDEWCNCPRHSARRKLRERIEVVKAERGER
jgi:hypothetical protein